MDQKTYTCPMHAEIKRETAGICPECGMRLIAASRKNAEANAEKRRMNHDKHVGHSTTMFLRKFWVSLVLTMPVVAYSDIFQMVFGFRLPPLEIGNWKLEILIPAVLGSAVFFYGGWVFLIGAWHELKARLPGMMTLIGIAISAAYFYSIYVEISKYLNIEAGHNLFWELTTLITVMLLGHWLEMRAVSGAQGALRELSKLLPDTAEVIIQPTTNNQQLTTMYIPIAELREDDIVFVRPGGRIPADGIVVDGKSDVNEAMVTGESQPVKKVVASEVIAGTINGDGSLQIKVTKIGEHTFLAGVMRLVEEAQASKSRLQILSDRAAFYLTVIAIGTGGLTFILWLLAKAGFGFALERLVAVLVIACPHALGLAVPLVASISTTLAARNGFLVKQRLALEAARKIDVVLFDKTGTLTKGEYGVQKIISNSQFLISNEYLLQLAAAVDNHSEHFAAKAIVAEAKKRNLELLEVKDFQRIPGKGVRGIVGGKEIFVGGLALAEDLKLSLPAEMKTAVEEENKKGKTIIYAASKDGVLGAFALADLIREESREAVQSLKTMGVKVAMITGDSEGVAKWVADELGIDEYFARVLPAEKAAIVKKLQKPSTKSQTIFNDQNSNNQNAFGISKIGIWNLFGNWKLGFGNYHKRVAFVGDGINDAPALTQADLGIAIGAGTNVAIESAGIILIRNDPRDIVKIIRLSRLTYAKMIQNLLWATGYNVVALPLAAGALASQGIILQPAFAAFFMSLSTVIVAINAMFLRRQTL